MGRWFETLLIGYNHSNMAIIKCTDFDVGSYHYIHRQFSNIDQIKGAAIIYFKEHNLDIHSLPNYFNISGAALTFNVQSSCSVNIHDLNHKFVNYKGPMLLKLLQNKMDLHYIQMKKIQNILACHQNQKKSKRRCSPPALRNNIDDDYKQKTQNQTNEQTVYKYDSSSTPPPNTKSINNQIIINQEYKYEYSSSSESEELFEDVSTEYYNLSAVLEAKHEKYGNAFKGNEHQKIFKEQSLNEMCRYCFMAKWSIKHKKECLFIPEWIKNGSGKAKKLMVYSKMAIFNGYQDKNDNDDDNDSSNV